jgi:hypothetical protein
MCAINFPLSVELCRVCDQRTSRMQNADVDSDWLERVHDLCALKRPPTETEKVENWRLFSALRLGYPVETAESIAADTSVDLNLLRVLVERQHVPLDLAARIA